MTEKRRYTKRVTKPKPSGPTSPPHIGKGGAIVIPADHEPINWRVKSALAELPAGLRERFG